MGTGQMGQESATNNVVMRLRGMVRYQTEPGNDEDIKENLSLPL